MSATPEMIRTVEQQIRDEGLSFKVAVSGDSDDVIAARIANAALAAMWSPVEEQAIPDGVCLFRDGRKPRAIWICRNSNSAWVFARTHTKRDS